MLFTIPELPSSAPDSDFQVRTWDLSDPTNPVETGSLGISPMPINAHGYFKSGDYLVIGPNWPPEAPWSFRADAPGSLVRTEFPGLQGAGVRGQLFQPWYVGDTWWSYGEIEGLARIERDGQVLATWDHLGLTGVVGHPFLIGDLLIHSWDLARSIGVDETLPADAVEATMLGLSRVPTEMLRGPDMFGEPTDVAEGASAQDQLLAFAGRTP